MTSTQKIRVGVLFLRRKRPGFDPDWGKEMEAAARAQLDGMEIDVFIPKERIVDDASVRRAVVECRDAGSDVLMTLQTTMSDGRLAPILGQIWDGPVVLWATPERQEGDMISACSLVGNHMFASTLRQLNRPFEIAYGMPGDDETTQQLNDAVRVAHAARRLQKSKIGLVGYHAPGFIDMHADPFLMSEVLGVELQHFSLHEFLAATEGVAEGAVIDDVRKVMEMLLPMNDVTVDDLSVASRYYLAMAELMGAESLDGITVRDWPELPNVVGQWPYLAMARLAAEGRAIGCEGDVDGTVGCLMTGLLGCGVSALSDWLEHDHETITLWHAGNAPFQLCEPPGEENGPAIGRHFNNGKPAVVDAYLKVDSPITISRLWHCDGEFCLMACDAETLQPKRRLKGTNGLAQITDRDVVDWFEELCHAGMPHHVVIVEGHHTDLLRRFARQMGVRWVP